MLSPPTPDPQAKTAVVQREAYTIYLEQATPTHAFVHCTIHGRWTKDTKRHLLEDWTLLKALHTSPIFALHDPKDLKHEKFLSMFGLKFTLAYTDALSGRLTHIYST